MKTGVPQGSVLSPLLFAIMLCDIPQIQDVIQILLADDITFYVSEDSVLAAQEKLQNAINVFVKWIKDWGLEVNPNKSKLMCFTRKRINRIPEITVGQEKITFVTRHCFLGVVLDGPYLTFKFHVEYLKISCAKRLDIMKRLAGRGWGCSAKDLLIFYKAYIRSKLDYACVIYDSASHTLLKQLDVIQSSALRIITVAFKSSPTISLHVESNLLPLTYWRKLRIATWFVKIQHSSLDHPVFQLFTSDYTKIHNFDWSSN